MCVCAFICVCMHAHVLLHFLISTASVLFNSRIAVHTLPSYLTKTAVHSQLCKRYPGFMRVALQDPQPERRFFRRGWATFAKNVNIKDICWNLNNIRVRKADQSSAQHKACQHGTIVLLSFPVRAQHRAPHRTFVLPAFPVSQSTAHHRAPQHRTIVLLSFPVSQSTAHDRAPQHRTIVLLSFPVRAQPSTRPHSTGQLSYYFPVRAQPNSGPHST